MYGRVDFEAIPERFVSDPRARAAAGTAPKPRWDEAAEETLGDSEAVDLMRTCTMLGDVVADAYAALIPQ